MPQATDTPLYSTAERTGVEPFYHGSTPALHILRGVELYGYCCVFLRFPGFFWMLQAKKTMTTAGTLIIKSCHGL